MAKGSENCCEIPKMDEIDKLTPSDMDKLGMPGLFNEEGESAQEDRDRRRRKQKSEKSEETDAPDTRQTRTGGKKYRNYFKRIIDNIMDTGEKFFDSDQDFN
jgi:hypothetical protein